MKFLFIDTETTGTDKIKHGVHQISGAVVIDNNIVEVFDIKFRPFENCEIDQGALEATNLTKEDLMMRDLSEKDGYNVLLKILDKYVNKYDKYDKFYLVGYNVHFDKDMLYEMFIRNKNSFLFSYIWGNHIDVMVLATMKLLELRKQMKNFKQGTVAKYLGFDIKEENLHNALYDIYVCIGIFCYISDIKFNINKEIDNFSTKENQLLTVLDYFAKPIEKEKENIKDKIILFGKYKNYRLGDVIHENPKYLIWLYENAKNQNLVSKDLYDELVEIIKPKRYEPSDKFIDYQIDSHMEDLMDY